MEDAVVQFPAHYCRQIISLTFVLSVLHVLLGGFPYPTINDRDLLEFLLEGERMEKPTNCTDEM